MVYRGVVECGSKGDWRGNDVVKSSQRYSIRRRESKGRRTNKVPSICTVSVDKFGVYVGPLGRFVVEKPILSLPLREIVEGLDDNYVGAIIRPIGGFIDTVDTSVEVFGQITNDLDINSWKAVLERTGNYVAAGVHWNQILVSVVIGG